MESIHDAMLSLRRNGDSSLAAQLQALCSNTVPMTIEHEVTGGLATWLDGFRYDPALGRVAFRTVVPSAPEVPARRVTFAAVRNYAEQPFDPALPRDATVLESLVGLDAHARNQSTWYVIHTSEREVTFYADTTPHVEILAVEAEGESGPPAA